MRKLNFIDQCIIEVNEGLNTLFATPAGSERKNPSLTIVQQDKLSSNEITRSAKLMRINHSGEVSAQGLYRGQALTAKNEDTKKLMRQSAIEENDHLNWCENRLIQLNSHKSILNPLWYIGSFSMGALAGLAGDKWSLGFVKETEDQVVRHLEKHTNLLPEKDLKSLSIIQAMKADEAHHSSVAQTAGAAKLPLPIRKIMMPSMSKMMTLLSGKI